MRKGQHRGNDPLSWPLLCAPGRIRTCDTRFRRAVLYPLSYEGGGLPKTVPETPGGCRAE